MNQQLTVREQQRREIAPLTDLLPSNVDPDRFISFGIAVLRDPELEKCSKGSKMVALRTCAQLGLYPSRELGHVWLVPFNNKIREKGKPDRWEKQVTLIPGYQGYIELARRSGEVSTIHSDIVRENDQFRVWTDENGRHLLHEPKPFGDRGAVVGVYCIAKLRGGSQIETMSRQEVLDVQSRSKASDSGPWQTDWEAMARKTVVRRARKYWPQSTELARLGEWEDQIERSTVESTTVSPIGASQSDSARRFTMDDLTSGTDSAATMAENPHETAQETPSGAETVDAVPESPNGNGIVEPIWTIEQGDARFQKRQDTRNPMGSPVRVHRITVDGDPIAAFDDLQAASLFAEDHENAVLDRCWLDLATIETREDTRPQDAERPPEATTEAQEEVDQNGPDTRTANYLAQISVSHWLELDALQKQVIEDSELSEAQFEELKRAFNERRRQINEAAV